MTARDTQYGNMLAVFTHKKIAAPFGGRYLGLCPRGEVVGYPTPNKAQGSPIKHRHLFPFRQRTMPNTFTPDELTALPAVLGRPRFERYLNHIRAGKAAPSRDFVSQALSLYHWNAQISGALLFPLHIMEITLRNGISNALEKVYGPSWPATPGFQQSIPVSAKESLTPLTTRYRSDTGKIISELPFFFWVGLLTSRHDQRVWTPYLSVDFPGVPSCRTVKETRAQMHDMADNIRRLRNRIAHHEPIFPRDIPDDYRQIRTLIAWRCPVTAAWLDRSQSVGALLRQRPESTP